MCSGVFYMHKNKDYRFYFPNPKAMLPVKKKGGEIALLPWGRRKQQSGVLPLGGWARLDSIYSGRWDRFFPTAIKIPVSQFMEKNVEGTSHWFDITEGKWIQGVVVKNHQEQRVYVVTIEPEIEDAIHERWPRILSG